MRVRIGKRQFEVVTDPGGRQRRIEASSPLGEAIKDVILRDLADDMLRISAPRLRRIGAQLQAVGEAQAAAIMPAIGHAIGQMQGGLDGGNLRGSSYDPFGLSKGELPWKELSFHYALAKQRAAASSRHNVDPRAGKSRNSHFILTGRLERWFLHTHRNFGGVKVRVSTRGLAERRTISTSGDKTKVLLGKFSISILPRLDTALMPGLASRRWTDVGDKEFERVTFGDRIANKLVGGPEVPYRPLALPIVQFFMLVRIPGAIRARMNQAARTVLEGGTAR